MLTKTHFSLSIHSFLGLFLLAALYTDARADCLGKEYEMYVQYFDGNNNGWKISCISDADDGMCAVTYRPVRPHESSSRVYSGGEAFTLDIYGGSARNMTTRIDTLLYNKTIHGTARRKGTGLLIFGEPEEGRIILNRAALLNEFESFLQGLRPAGPPVKNNDAL